MRVRRPDIENRSAPEQALYEGEERYRKLVELLPDAVLIHRDGRFLFANQSAARLLGARHPNELIGLPILDIVHPDYHEAVRERVDAEIADGVEVPIIEETFIRLDGREIEVEVAGIGITFETSPAGLIVVRDITQRKRAEDVIRRSEERFRTLLESAPDAVVLIDADGRIVLVNDQTERFFGYAREELLGQRVEILLPERLREAHASHRASYLAEPTTRPMGVGLELTGWHKNGSEIPLEVSLASLETEAGRLVMAFIRDVSERVEAQRAVRDAETRFRTLVEQVPAVTYIWDFRRGVGQARVPYVSPQMEQVLGFPPQAFMAEANFWFERVHPADRDGVIAETARSVEAGEPFHMEYRMIARDGRIVWVCDDATAILQEASGRVLVHQGILVDITGPKRMDEELRTRWDQLRRADAERRRLLSRLVVAQEEERSRIASNIHDDPVQKITAVAMRLDTLAADHPELAEDAKFPKLQESVRHSIGSLRHLMFEIRPYSLDRDGGLDLALRSMTELEAAADASVQYEVTWDVRSALSPETATILYRIAQEAVVNARKHARASHVRLAVADQGTGISLLVQDDGVGFSREAGADSPPGHLGLTAMRERAETAGGTFRIRSSPGGGTTMEVWLPLAGMMMQLGSMPEM